MKKKWRASFFQPREFDPWAYSRAFLFFALLMMLGLPVLFVHSEPSGDKVSSAYDGRVLAGGPLSAKEHFEDQLHGLEVEVPGDFSFILIDPARDQVISHRAEESFEAASIYKLYVAAAALEAASKEEIQLTPDDYDAMELAICYSDNATAEYLGQERLGWDQIENYVRQHGYDATSFNPIYGGAYTGIIETNPIDVSQFLSDLIGGRLLAFDDTAYFLRLLQNQEHRHALNLGLDDQAIFLHKTGWLDNVFHDAGYLLCDGRMVIVVAMTSGWTAENPEASRFYQDLGRAVEDYLHASAQPFGSPTNAAIPYHDLYGSLLSQFVARESGG